VRARENAYSKTAYSYSLRSSLDNLLIIEYEIIPTARQRQRSRRIVDLLSDGRSEISFGRRRVARRASRLRERSFVRSFASPSFSRTSKPRAHFFLPSNFLEFPPSIPRTSFRRVVFAFSSPSLRLLRSSPSLADSLSRIPRTDVRSNRAAFIVHRSVRKFHVDSLSRWSRRLSTFRFAAEPLRIDGDRSGIDRTIFGILVTSR